MKQETWSSDFRSKINDYVFRKGSDGEPQTWPLIRKVILHGPWAVLSSGAVLLDLPGVRDANAARAKVAESYTQHCNRIWIVAPIQRAVDDGTARSLMGEEFKRTLLMDGQYCNVSFICTQTDDCEVSECIQEHKDVLMASGNWNEVFKLIGESDDLAKEIRTLKHDLKVVNNDTKSLERQVKNLRGAEDADSEAISVAETEWKDKQMAGSIIDSKLKDIKEKKRLAHERICSLVATARNKYSRKRIQEDFRAGHADLVSPNDNEDFEEQESAGEEQVMPSLPEGFDLDVFCTSSNDYLKIKDIADNVNGEPRTFDSAEDTEIPLLRGSVHKTTVQSRTAFAAYIIKETSNLLDRIKLCASQDPEVGSSEAFRKAFEKEKKMLDARMEQLVASFIEKVDGCVNLTLKPSMKAGASRAKAVTMDTFLSWGSKNKRSKHMRWRNPDQNGLYWYTFCEACRHDGSYNSPTAGKVDLNQELLDPMEKKYTVSWQNTMGTTLQNI